MAPVEQLGEDSWSVVCAAGCRTALVLAIMHLCSGFFLLFFLSPDIAKLGGMVDNTSMS